MSKFFNGLEKYIYWTSIPKMGINDIVDILIVSVMIYLIVKWIKTTRAWVLLKGIIAVFWNILSDRGTDNCNQKKRCGTQLGSINSGRRSSVCDLIVCRWIFCKQ